MGSGSYRGGHTKIFISDSGTQWEVSDRPSKQQDELRRQRWDDEIGVETGRGHRRVSKEGRSFLSMCAEAFRRDVLSESIPKPPRPLESEVRLAGGNKKWIATDPLRLQLLEKFFRKRPPVV